MNITYVVTYLVIMICFYICELIIFGLWYKIHNHSNVRYFRFLRMMLDYYCYVLTHLPDLLSGETTDAPESSSLQWLFALFMPIVLPSFMLISTNHFWRIAIFVLALYVVFGELFRERKTEASVQIDKWVRFLFDSTDRPEGYASSETKSVLEPEKNHPLSKEEIRTNRIFGFILAIIGIILLVVLVFGSISNLKHGFRISSNPFILFADEKYNTVFMVLLAIVVILILCFLFWTPQDRKEAKAHAAAAIEYETQKAANRLGISKGIIIDPQLGEWEKAIIRICSYLGIKRAAIISEDSCVENMSGKIALSAISKEGIPTVVLSIREINKQRTKYSPQLVHDMVRFLLGHELTHIRYKDYSRRKRALQEAGCLILAMILFYFGIRISIPLSTFMKNISIACQAVSIGIILITFRTFANDRYWRYVSEYRADRISAAISGANDEAVIAMLNVYSEEENSDIHKKPHKKSISHPKLKSRLKELSRKKKWGISEYFRYAFKLLL